jgi:hypothetical protein
MSFSWWQDAVDGHFGQMTTTPEWGYYKTRRKNGAWEPVAIWEEDGVLKALRNGEPTDPHQVWEWCRTHPVEYEDYMKAIRMGVWDADDPTVAAAMNAGIGHNVGEVDELDLLRDQIESAKQGAAIYSQIESDDEAAKAQSLRARMNELAGTADKAREKLKRPYLEAGKAIDAEWQPLIKEAKAVADLIRRAISDYETIKLQERRREEQRLRQLELDRQREGAPQIGEPAPPPPPPTVAVRGTYGRAATVGTELVVTQITDDMALFNYLRGSGELNQFMVQLAQRAVKAGYTVPGVEVSERARIS